MFLPSTATRNDDSFGVHLLRRLQLRGMKLCKASARSGGSGKDFPYQGERRVRRYLRYFRLWVQIMGTKDSYIATWSPCALYHRPVSSYFVRSLSPYFFLSLLSTKGALGAAIPTSTTDRRESAFIVMILVDSRRFVTRSKWKSISPHIYTQQVSQPITSCYANYGFLPPFLSPFSSFPLTSLTRLHTLTAITVTVAPCPPMLCSANIETTGVSQCITVYEPHLAQSRSDVSTSIQVFVLTCIPSSPYAAVYIPYVRLGFIFGTR
ncbi:hypothetical protein BDP27DRAFT_1345468 [Rhodocollybia butyracea]|uniref:Uncharacterized protein n=1 Tax=Rhodocollybia butyracea TaxID=206335 RepID=A0A9P5TWK0_9AGAR|nr:hypothetical protein BDP27DRAFT_1345468 [Rhodocollybia butyracea]